MAVRSGAVLVLGKGTDGLFVERRGVDAEVVQEAAEAGLAGFAPQIDGAGRRDDGVFQRDGAVQPAVDVPSGSTTNAMCVHSPTASLARLSA
ncbi:MAG: hypothetical protein PUE00_03580 [Thermobifida fusca]|nr:hypothetical protein [Thermobifida fusca]